MKRKVTLIGLLLSAILLGVLLVAAPFSEATVAVTPQTVVDEGITPTYTALTMTGVIFANNGKCIIHVKNDYTGTATIVIATPNLIDGLAMADQTFTVTAGLTKFAGPFPQLYYNERTGANRGKATVTSDQALSVTIAVIKY